MEREEELSRAVRGLALVRDLHALLREWGLGHGVELWHAYVMATNAAARVLARNHRGMPVYRPVGNADVFTLTFLGAGRAGTAYEVATATPESIIARAGA